MKLSLPPLCDWLAMDTETTGVGRGDRIFAFSFCTPDGKTFFARYPDDAKGREKVRQEIKVLVHCQKVLVFHNAAFDLRMLARERIIPPRSAVVHDTLIAARVCRSDEPSLGLKELALWYAKIPTTDEAKLLETLAGKHDYSKAPSDLLEDYARRDAYRTAVLFHLYQKILKKNAGLRKAYALERSLIPVTLGMEKVGIAFNRPAAQKGITRLHGMAAKMLGSMRRYTGLPKFNPNSTKQLGRFLFNDLGLPVVVRSLKTSAPSTNKESLLELRRLGHRRRFLWQIFEYRAYLRAESYLKKYACAAVRCGRDWVVHAHWNQVGAKTFRYSSSQENLHNISKGEKSRAVVPVDLRFPFCARKGMVNICFDYAQQEARLAAHYIEVLLGDSTFADLFRSGVDPYVTLAKMVWRGRITGQKRFDAKTTFLAKTYGLGVDGLADALGVTVDEAEKVDAEFNKRFPVLKRFFYFVKNKAEKQGFVENRFGYRLRVDPERPYSIVNHLIQSTAAGVTKTAMKRVADHLAGLRFGALVLTLHDEVMFQIPSQRYGKSLVRRIKTLVEDFDFTVPMLTEWSVVRASWNNAKEIVL